MPHLSIEHSAALEADRMTALCLDLRLALLGTGVFEEGAIRVRCLPCAVAAVADLHPDNRFAAMILRIGAGRGMEDKQRIGRAVMAAAEAHFADLLAEPHFALSLDLVENDPGLSWKTNSIHSRLRA